MMLRFRKHLFILLCLNIAVACAPVQQQYIKKNQTPKLLNEALRMSDGVELPTTRWEVAKPKAVILAVHGFNDYSNAFELFATEMQSSNIATIAYDQRGFGRNQSQGIWGGQENLARDMCDAAALVQKKYKNVPMFILGESMGAAVIIHAMHECMDSKPKGLILSAPAIWGQESMNPLLRASLWVMAHTVPSKTFTGENLNIRATDNTAVLIEMSKDPNVVKSTRVDSIYGLQQLMDVAYSEAQYANAYDDLPVLILYGKRDQVVPKAPVDYLQSNLKKSDYYIYEEGYHMLLRDKQRARVYDEVLQWIKKQK